MRRAGYEVRVLPEEGASFEQNPPTLIEFIRRDLRWCQGNMQYWHFLVMPGLKCGQPLPARVRAADVPRLARPGSGCWCSARSPSRWPDPARRSSAPTPACLVFAHRAGDVVRAEDRDRDRRADASRRCGAASAAASALSRASSPRRSSSCCWRRSCGSRTPCSSARLLAGRSVGWGAQARDDHSGAVVAGGAAALAAYPARRGVARPAGADRAGGDPLCPVRRRRAAAVDPARGRHRLAGARPRLVRIGLGRLPEETAPPPEMAALALPAVELRGRTARVSLADKWRTLRGVVRSLRIYYGNRARRGAMDRLYRPFRRSRAISCSTSAPMSATASHRFRRLGARVVAVEPQPALARTLKLLYGRDRAVAIEAVAVGRAAGIDRAQAQSRQPDGVDRLRRLHQGRRRRAGLGGPALDQDRARAGDHARRA